MYINFGQTMKWNIHKNTIFPQSTKKNNPTVTFWLLPTFKTKTILKEPIWWDILPDVCCLVDWSNNIGNPINLKSSTFRSNGWPHKAGLTDRRLAKIAFENLKQIQMITIYDVMILRLFYTNKTELYLKYYILHCGK